MMQDTQRRGRGRPSSPVLSREKIVDAAFRVLARQGAGGFSLTRVAALLGTQRAALYNHINDRDELIALMRERVTADIDWSGFGVLPWDQAFVPLAWSYRAVFSREAELSTLLAVTPITTAERSFRNRGRCTRALIEAGWPEYLASSVIVAVESFVIGSGLDVLAESTPSPTDTHADDPDVAAYWHAVAAAERYREGENLGAADQAFKLGLDAVLDGLRARLATIRGDTPRGSIATSDPE